MKKRKLVFLTLDITVSGGIERVISNMVGHYSLDSRFDIEIISFFKRNEKLCYHIPENVKINYISNQTYDLTSIGRKIKSHIFLVFFLMKYQPEHNSVLISTITNISIYLALFRFKYKRQKLIAAEHGYYYAFGKLTRILRFCLYRFVDIVVTLTHSEKENYDKFCNKVVVIPNALSFYPPTTADINNKRIISVGRLVYEKGFENLLPIYIKLANKYPDWNFVIFGSGYLEDTLKTFLIAAPVNVKLYSPSEYIQEELLKSSIYVCSSTTEAFPMVLLEAQACGLSIVSFDCPPGPREILADKFNGLLIPPNNFKLLSDAIEQMINNPKKRMLYSINARESAKRFLPEHIYKLWDSLFVE